MTVSDDDALVLDRAHLAQYTGGDRALEAELFALLDAQIDTCLAAMAEAGDAEAWRTAAHTLKGAAGGVGAKALATACAEAEAAEPCAYGAALIALREAGAEVRAEIAAAETA